MPAMVEGTTSNRSKLIRSVIIRFGVVGIILALILGTKKYDWSVYMQEFTAANRLWLVLSFCLLGVVHCLGALRWYFLLRVQDIQLRYSKVLQVNLIGFFFSQFLPSNVGGDAVKIFYAMRQTPGKKANAALSMVMDRVLGLIAILFLTLLMLPMEWERLGSNPQTRPVIIGLAIVLICIFAGLIAGALFPFHRLPSFFHRLWEKVPKRDILETLYNGFHAHGKNLRYTLAAIGAAAVTVVPLLSMGWFLARSLNLDTGIGPMIIIFGLVICAMSAPLPGGHGMREGAFVILFPIFAVTRGGELVGEETALACSTLLLGISLLWAFVGGVIYLTLSHRLKAEATDDT
jgi:uncharacterized protein (TIRG00374 family)